MKTGARRFRSLAVGAACTALLVTGLPPATAESVVTVRSSGPASIVTSTDSSTGRVVATFAISDPTLTATGATICRSYGEFTRRGCRYQRFDGQAVDDSADWYDEWDEPSYDDDDEYVRWDIVGQPGNWTVSYPVGFDGISREECLTAAWKKAPFLTQIQVMNDAGAILGTGEWSTQVTCTGIEGNATGPASTRVSAGRSTQSKPFTFLALDAKRVLTSYRICRYSSITGRYSACDLERLTAKDRSGANWFLSYTVSWRPLGSTVCQYYGRKWLQSGLRVQFYDRAMSQRLSLFWGTKVDC